jgi:hypothetical protein
VREPLRDILVVIGCSGEKSSAASPAVTLYRSRRFHASIRWAERVGAPWVVLSAKHGILDPDAIIDPYDVHLSNLTAEEQTAWAEKAAESLRLRTAESAKLVFLCDDVYTRPVAKCLRPAGRHCFTPLDGVAVADQTYVIDRMPLKFDRE